MRDGDDIIPLDEARRRQQGDELAALIDDVDPIRWQGKPIPQRRWLVPGLIPWRNVTLLGGDGGLGKSLLALQLQASAALGKDWLGRSVEPVKSYGFYAEDDSDEIQRRLADIVKHHDADFGDLEKMLVAPRVGQNNILAWPNRENGLNATRLYDGLLEKCRRFGAQLLIIDTVADVYGGNENYRNEVRAFIGLLRNLALEINGAVILTAHPSQAGLATGSGISGSTAWNNSVRSRLYLTRPKNADNVDEPLASERILRSMKANYAGLAGDIAMDWRDGVFVASEEPQGMLRTIDHRNQERAFLDCLDAATQQGRNVSDYRSAQNYAPKIFGDMPESGGTSRKNLQAAMNRLFASKDIAMGEAGMGTDRKPRRGIIRTPNKNPI
jgi:RecA-family ATPase